MFVSPCASVKLEFHLAWRGRRAGGGKFSEKNLHSPAWVVVGSGSGRFRVSPGGIKRA